MTLRRLSFTPAGRVLAASAVVSVGAGTLAYWVSGVLGTDVQGLPPTVGPLHVAVGALRLAAVAVGVAAFIGVIVLIRSAPLPKGAYLVAGTLVGAAVVCGWAWRGLTVGFVGSNVVAALACGSAGALWIAAAAGALSWHPWPGTADRIDARGCGHCAQDKNLLEGDVQLLSVVDDNGLVLLRCPRCSWLYVTTLPAFTSVTTIDEAQAREAFPNNW